MYTLTNFLTKRKEGQQILLSIFVTLYVFRHVHFN